MCVSISVYVKYVCGCTCGYECVCESVVMCLYDGTHSSIFVRRNTIYPATQGFPNPSPSVTFKAIKSLVCF